MNDGSEKLPIPESSGGMEPPKPPCPPVKGSAEDGDNSGRKTFTLKTQVGPTCIVAVEKPKDDQA